MYIRTVLTKLWARRSGRVLVVFSGLVLLATSLFWAILSAQLQNYNADQLIDSYLFESSHTLQAASFPSAHTFLIKWPLFALTAAFGNTTIAITIMTVLCALVPVVALAGLLAFIERRPLVLSAWFVALASMLLLVPAQPSPGTLLPVNFAMFTTRNIEYAVFLAVLWLFITVRSWRDPRAWLAVTLTALLLASDGLFLPLLFGAVLAVWSTRRRRPRRPLAWLAMLAAGFVAARLLVSALTHWSITSFNGQGSSPYNLVTNVHQLAEAVAYAVLNIGTLFGANPAYAHLSLSGWPHALQQALHVPADVAYTLNALLLLSLVGLAVYFIATYRRRHDRASQLALMLLGAAAAATAVFVGTDHYYPVDGRYLTVWFFALIVTAAVVLRSVRLPKNVLLSLLVVLLLVIPCAAIGSYDQYQANKAGLQPYEDFQSSVTAELAEQRVSVLVGDYWDVTPIKQAAHNELTIVPMADCTTPLTALSSSAWQQRPTYGGAVAYLVNSNPFPTNFKRCDPTVIAQYFGEPDSKVAINTPGHENSWLYVYDNGMNHVIPHGPRPKAQPVVQQPEPLPRKDCPQGSVLNIVAHEDDDLLFLNPDLQASIDAGKCITTVFVTAGDAGAGESYSTVREKGSEAAYAYMYNAQLPGVWQSRKLHVNDVPLTYATMDGAPGLSLIFLNLPDGNMRGNGFTSRDNASLARLRGGSINAIAPLEGKGSYTADQLTAMLLLIMNTYQPDEVRTQNYSNNRHDGDHSDHHAVGYFATEAFKNYHAAAILRSYAGYTTRLLPTNVSGSVLAAKEGAFFTYAGFDGAACASVADCYGVTAYGSYLPRQYSRVVATRQPSLPSQVAAVPKPAYLAAPRAPKSAPIRRSCMLGGRPQVIACPFVPQVNLVY